MNRRTNLTAEQKAEILKRHLVEKAPVSDLCEEFGVHPTAFYRWQKALFENAAVALETTLTSKRRQTEDEERIDALEKKLRAKDEVLGELMEEYVALKKKLWGDLKGRWVPHDTRDRVIDFTSEWSEKTEIPVLHFIRWLGTGASKFYQWRERYGKANEHNGKIPRDWWLENWEKEAIIAFHLKNPLEGYRRLTFMMLDQDIVAVSPTSTWRVLNAAGLLRRWSRKTSKKGKGFDQPKGPHEHWHVDVSYINIHGTFYYLLSILDGYSRFIVHWELRESMTEADVEVILQRARERFPGAKPRIITDNGPQFIAKDFKEFIRICGMTHVKTAPYYPQSNGKIERWHQSLKGECIRPGTPLSLEDARRLLERYVEHYNTVRLHSAVGYVTPKDKLEGKEEEIFRERDQKLEAAREMRRRRRQASMSEESPMEESSSEQEHHGGTAPGAGGAQDASSKAESSHGPLGAAPPAPRRVDHLRTLRNDVDVRTVLSDLGIPTKHRGRRLTFRCPACGDFHTATNPRTNLARCFRCQRNFNPIDLVMAEHGSTFLDAVTYLDRLLPLAASTQ